MSTTKAFDEKYHDRPQQRYEPGELNSQQAMRVVMTAAGSLAGIHATLDAVRDGWDPQNPLDHNVEQAQVSIEVAMMRCEQLARELERRIEEERRLETEVDPE